MFHVKHHPPDNSTIRLRFTWNTLTSLGRRKAKPMFHVKHQSLSNTTKPQQPTTPNKPPRFTWNNRNYEITKGKPKIAVWKCHSPLPAIPTISVSRETWKLIQRPQTWLVFVSKEKQARWFILSDFPLVSVGRFSQLLNKLQASR